MFKRFLVMDLFYTDDLTPINEWIDVEKEIPNKETGLYRVRLNNGDEISAYFCRDKCAVLLKCFKNKPSYWWEKSKKTPLYKVTHWGRLKNENVD